MSSCGCECGGSHATVRQVLMDEHRVIEKVLDAVDRMQSEAAFDATFLTQSLDFFRNFADGCHHAKEENELFPALEEAGVPRKGGPIGCMLRDHEDGRGFLRTISENLDAASRRDAEAMAEMNIAAGKYVTMLRHHIQKEDSVLFVIAENLLPAERKSRMLRDFESKPCADGEAGMHDRYVKLAQTLSEWRFTPVTLEA